MKNSATLKRLLSMLMAVVMIVTMTVPVMAAQNNGISLVEVDNSKVSVNLLNKEEALAILETEICDCTQVIVDIYSRFLFEKSVFEHRKESALSVEEIKELMIEAQKKAYGDGLDQEYLHPYMWAWKPHYYDAEYNYYNFPYAFGLLFCVLCHLAIANK